MACCICVGVIGVVLLLLVIFKIALKLNTRWDRSSTSLVGKTVIVTGANTGIGFYTAQDFAKRGARVILACRDKKRAENARDEIIQATDNQNVVVKLVDFASLSSVRSFVKQIYAEEKRLDILVNNAGAIGFDDITTTEGNNLLIQVNYLGPFLLTLLLIDLLKKSAPSRIVNVASDAAQYAQVKPEDLNDFPAGSSKIKNYGITKLLNVLFSTELAKRLKGTGVVSNSLHPGVIRTEILRNFSPLVQMTVNTLANPFFKSPEEGAQTTIHVALSKEIEGVTGEYFENCRIAWFPSMPKPAKDERLRKKIWEKSEKLVKLTPEECQL